MFDAYFVCTCHLVEKVKPLVPVMEEHERQHLHANTPANEGHPWQNVGPKK